MRLYQLHRCPFGHQATIVLQEKGLSFETVFFKQGNRPPEMEAIGPFAKSPTLFDGDLRIWDSQIVIDYLEDRYPQVALLPADAAGRAEVRMISAQATADLGAKAGVMAVETLYKRQPDPAKVEEAKQKFVEALDWWDRRLQGRTFVVGDSLTLADVTLFTIFPSMRALSGIEIPAARPHLRAWFDRMAARPTTKLLEPQVT
jgi:glutathione S-transferase